MTMRLYFLFTFFMLRRYTEMSSVTMMSTLFRRWPVGHKATKLGSLLLKAEGEGASGAVGNL